MEQDRGKLVQETARKYKNKEIDFGEALERLKLIKADYEVIKNDDFIDITQDHERFHKPYTGKM